MKYRFAGDAEPTRIPSHKEVCPRCNGEGVHDCWEGGMTRDEMDEQGPEFYEDYMSGTYDRQCTECKGVRVVDVADVDQMDAGLRARYEQEQQDMAEMAAEREMERRMGC